LFALGCALLLVLAQPSQAYAPKTANKASANHTKHHARRARKGAWKRHGQQKIDSDRAREIQTALIREKYMDGEPSGNWDAQTKAAMTRYQADHGWQTKMLPDSRALISLGLGPSHENLLNPESVAPATPAGAAPATTQAGRPLQLVENKNHN
jgi:peptidoglycan hydrolase-like protein with peptidoglycan-binding domain